MVSSVCVIRVFVFESFIGLKKTNVFGTILQC